MWQPILFALVLTVGAVHTPQSPAPISEPALAYTRSIAVPLNGLMLHDKAVDAWSWTFGREPGAKTLRNDREAGIIEGSAQVNYRSEMLTLREETMGAIRYHVVLNVTAGECRITVNELIHSGNRTTARGGVHLGRLTRGTDPVKRVRGAGGSNGRRIYADVKAVAEARINALLQAFEARLRASAEP